MVFVHKYPLLAGTLAVLLSAALLLMGNGLDSVWPVMWVALIPVLLFAAETSSSLAAGSSAMLAMLLGSLPMLRYLHFILKLPVTAWLVPFSIASFLFAIGVLLFRALLRQGSVFNAAIALPAFWSLCEYGASFVPASGTAGSLSYTQLRFLPILQVASITGPWGITFLLLLFPATIVTAIHLRDRSCRRVTLAIGSLFAVLAAAIMFGIFRLTVQQPHETIKVGLVDTDSVVFAEGHVAMQDLLGRYAAEAETVARQGAKIVVMPEKTGLLLDRDASSFDPILQSVADKTRVTLVIGVLHAVGRDSFNEARIYAPNSPVTTYDKQHMLPPFESNLTPGRSLTMLRDQPALVGVAICKDMDFVHPALDYGRAGIGLLLDPAWDFQVDRAWHGHIAIMRGVEGGYAIAHAAKDGYLTVTNNRGQVLGEVRTDSSAFASLLVDVPLIHNTTLFDRLGTWFPWLTAVLLLGAVFRLIRPGPADIHSPS